MVQTFSFLADQIPFGYAFNFDNYLFNKVKHINSQGIQNRADYFIVNNVRKRIEGKIHFLLKDNEAYSPYQSLFGSFEFNPRVSGGLLEEFWNYIEADLIQRGIRSISITHPAECYHQVKAQKVNALLINHNFEIVFNAVNHHIEIDEDRLVSKMHLMEQRRLAKCEREGFKFTEHQSSDLEMIYSFLDQCRTEQGLDISISKDKLALYAREFPQDYLPFSVKKDDKIVAATIAIRVNRYVLYKFLHGNLKAYHNFSPAVLLMDGLYRYCQKHGYEKLDLGISTTRKEGDQDSLISFKERMGGVRSQKHFYRKKL